MSDYGKLSKYKKYGTVIILVLILLFYFINVFQRTNWGSPLLLHPDEPTVVDSAFRMAHNHTFLPDVYNRPDYFEIIINFFVNSILSPILFRTSYALAFPVHIFFFYRMARCITMAFGLGIIVLAYFTANKFHKNAGIVCALLFAVYPLFMDNAYFATPDIPLAFMAMLTIFFGVRYLEKPGYLNLLGMSLSVSAATAIKYPGIIGACVIAIVVIQKSLEKRQYLDILKKGAVAAAAIIVGLFIIAPGLFLHIQNVRTAIKSEARTNHLGADGLGFSGNALFYAKQMFTNLGVMLAIFFVLGLIALFLTRNRSKSPLIMSLVYWICMSVLPLHWDRWSLPMMISPLLLSGLGIVYLYEWVKKQNFQMPIAKIAVLFLYAVIFLSPILSDIAGTVEVLIPDARKAALDYCNENNITPNQTINDGYTPFSPGEPRIINTELAVNDDKIKVLQNSNEQKKYVIVSGEMSNRFYAERDRYSKVVAVYETLKKDTQKLAEFDPVQRTSSVSTIKNIYDQIVSLKSINSKSVSGYKVIIYHMNHGNGNI